jgi:cytochrome bd-type quinol oxidase subunit 2
MATHLVGFVITLFQGLAVGVLLVGQTVPFTTTGAAFNRFRYFQIRGSGAKTLQ